MSQARPVVIVGGGLAGLTAALHLAERGLPVTVLEADPRFPGGRVSGKEPIQVGDWSFPGEHGMHGIWSPYHNLQAMLGRNHIRPVFVPAQEEDWIYRRGSRIKKAAVGSAIRQSPVPAPFHYLNLFLRPSFLAALGPRDWLSLFQVWYSLLFAVGIDPLGEDQPLEGLKMSDLTGKLAPAIRAFFIGLARSGLSGQPDEIPLSGFLAFLRFYTVLRRDAWAFCYLPTGGGHSLIDPLVKRLEELGGKVVLGAKVTCVEKTEEGWRVHWENVGQGKGKGEGRGEGQAAEAAATDPKPHLRGVAIQPSSAAIAQIRVGRGRTPKGSSSTPRRWGFGILAAASAARPSAWLDTPHLILAADSPSAARLLQASPATAGQARDLFWPRGMETAVVRLWFDRTPAATSEAGIFSGDFVLDNFFWLDRIQEPYVRWRRATGGSAIEAHIYGPPELLAQPDAALLARAIGEVLAAFPELRGHKIHQMLQRNPAAHTLFGVGPRERHLSTRTPWPGLFCCGDWVRHPTPALFLERATVTGIAAANAVLEEQGLLPWPLLEHPKPEPFVGWIEQMMKKGRAAKKKRRM